MDDDAKHVILLVCAFCGILLGTGLIAGLIAIGLTALARGLGL